MKEFVPQLKVLPPAQKRIWPKLAFTKDLGFCLYGGTALALQLGHRQSVDFDFFSDKSFSADELLNKLPFAGKAKILQCEQDTLTLQIDGVFISFFGSQRYGRAGEPLLTCDNTIFVASLLDILGLKLKTLFDRVEWKDYYDITWILRQGISLKDGLGVAMSFFGDTFIAEHCLMALTYFEGVDSDKFTPKDQEELVHFVRQTEMPVQPAQVISNSLLPSDYSEKQEDDVCEYDGPSPFMC